MWMQKTLGRMLIDDEVISESQLEKALAIQSKGDPHLGLRKGTALGHILVASKYASVRSIAKNLCAQFNRLDYILVDGLPIDPTLALRIGQNLAGDLGVLPLVYLSKGMCIVLSTRKLTSEESSELARQAGAMVDALPADDQTILPLIQKVYYTIQRRDHSNVRLGEVLIRQGLLTSDQLDTAITIAREEGIRLGEYLTCYGMVEEDTICRIIASQARVQFLEDSEARVMQIDYTLAAQPCKEYIRFNLIIPAQLDGPTLKVLTADPLSEPGEELLGLTGARKMERLAVQPTTFRYLFQQIYGEELIPHEDDPSHVGEELVLTVAEEASDPDTTYVNIRDLKVRYTEVVNSFLSRSIAMRASDIHIDNLGDRVDVRVRVDGILHHLNNANVTSENLRGIVNILKVEAELDITQSRIPQGGSFRRQDQKGRAYDFRIHIVPSVHGENVVIRILPAGRSVAGLESLGLQEQVLADYRRALCNPFGMLLVTGPTGSGKTTTLCSSLKEIGQSPDRKILTVEDPVEYSIPNTVQCETIPAKNVGFAAMARAFMRMDPDVILIGEIRDQETAIEALRLSYSGHLILATLHTSSSITAIERLHTLGVERANVLDQMLAIISQRLLRRLCICCRRPLQPTPEDLRRALPCDFPPDLRFYESPGCETCNHLGHFDRELLMEFLNFTPFTRQVFREEVDIKQIHDRLVGRSLHTILDDALFKVHTGRIDFRWLPSAIHQDDLQQGPTRHLTLPDIPAASPDKRKSVTDQIREQAALAHKEVDGE